MLAQAGIHDTVPTSLPKLAWMAAFAAMTKGSGQEFFRWDRNTCRLKAPLPYIGDAGQLPGVHRDPFDRMRAAQARAEGLTLVSCDAEFASLGVKTLGKRIYCFPYLIYRGSSGKSVQAALPPAPEAQHGEAGGRGHLERTETQTPPRRALMSHSTRIAVAATA